MRTSLPKRVLKISFVILLGLVCLVVAGGYAIYNDVTRSPLPQIDGQLYVPGLRDSVEVIRDGNGIPNIYTTSMHDLYFAQGYTVAQDRWWQMEWSRHLCSGRIEELTGSTSYLALDILLRTMGWKQLAEQDFAQSSEEVKAMLTAFADGANAYVSSRTPGQLAMEYAILSLESVKVKVEPWTPADTLAFTRLMAYDLSYDIFDRLRSDWYGSLGKDMTDEFLNPPWPYGEKPTILDEEDVPEIADKLAPRTERASSQGAPTGSMPASTTDLDVYPLSTDPSGIGSNSWVATGDMTQDGNALLANDPHLDIQMPSIWYEVGLHCTNDGTGTPFDVVGFAFPASPGVVIGHNGSIAWAITNAYPDVCDYYRIKVNPDDVLQYEWNGKWRTMTVRKENISFGRGKKFVTIDVRMTHLGPIVNDNKIDPASGKVLGFNNEDPLALRWTGLEPNRISRAMIGINQAKNWGDFREALQYWDLPSQNFLYADTEGNIGYQMAGLVPIRSSQNDGMVPVEGRSDDYEWKGFIPFDLLPHTYNPELNYIVAANQAAALPEYEGYLAEQLGEGNFVLHRGGSYGYRAQRISDLLTEMAPNTRNTFETIQNDAELMSAREILPYVAGLRFDNADLDSARDWLLEWDYQLSADSPQAALYSVFWAQLVSNTFGDELAANVSKSFPQIKAGGGSNRMRGVNLMLETPTDPWWDDVATKRVVETRDDMLSKSFRQAYEKTAAALGKDRDRWSWKKLHTAKFVSSPLGNSGIGLIERIVNRGPFGVGGGSEAVVATGFEVDNFATTSIPSMRMIVDTTDFSNCIAVNSTGQSGHPASPHYGDMIEEWRTGKYHKMLWTPQQVEDSAAHRLILNPA